MFVVLVQLIFQIITEWLQLFPGVRRAVIPYKGLPNEGIHKAATLAILVVGKLAFLLAFLVALNEVEKPMVPEVEPNRVLPLLKVGEGLLQLNNRDELESQSIVQVGRDKRKLSRVVHVYLIAFVRDGRLTCHLLKEQICRPTHNTHRSRRFGGLGEGFAHLTNSRFDDVAKVKDWKDVVGNERTKTGERWPVGV